MLMVAPVSLLTGAVLGLRFPAYALLPAFALACVAIGMPALINNGVLTAVWQTGTALVLLQVGYFAGIFTRFVILAARSPIPSSASLQRSSQRWPIRQDVPTAL